MGFSEGLEDEFLLTCFVCKSPFGMLAMFCGECGCKRDQALGIERASTRQQIINNDLVTPSFIQQAPEVPDEPLSYLYREQESADQFARHCASGQNGDLQALY